MTSQNMRLRCAASVKYAIAGPNGPNAPARSPAEAFFVDISTAFLVTVSCRSWNTDLDLQPNSGDSPKFLQGLPDTAQISPDAAALFSPSARADSTDTKHRNGVNLMKPLLHLPAQGAFLRRVDGIVLTCIKIKSNN